MALDPTRAAQIIDGWDSIRQACKALWVGQLKAHGAVLGLPWNRSTVPTDGVVEADAGDLRTTFHADPVFREVNGSGVLRDRRGPTWQQVLNALTNGERTVLTFLLRRVRARLESHDARTNLVDFDKVGAVMIARQRDAGGTVYECRDGFGIASAQTHGWRAVVP